MKNIEDVIREKKYEADQFEGVLNWLKTKLQKKCERIRIAEDEREKKLLALRDILLADFQSQQTRKAKVKDQHIIRLIEKGEELTFAAAGYIAAEEGMKRDDFLDFVHGVSRKWEYDN